MSNTLAAYKGRLSSNANPNINQGINIFYDLDDQNAFSITHSGGGSVVNDLLNVSFPYFGQVSLGGQYNGDKASLSGTDTILESFSSVDYQTLVYPEAASSLSTNKYKFSFGVGQAEFYVTNNAKFQISIGFDPDVSVNWICSFVSTSGTTQTQITTVPVTTAATMLRVNANRNACYFYINNVLVASFLHGLSEFNTNPLYGIGIRYNYERGTSTVPGQTPAVRIDALKIAGTYLTPREFVNV